MPLLTTKDAAVDEEAAYPTMINIKMGPETRPLYDALNAGSDEDGVDRTNRIRALIDIWSKDPTDEDAPPWLAELQELVTNLGREYSLSRQVQSDRNRGGRKGPRRRIS